MECGKVWLNMVKFTVLDCLCMRWLTKVDMLQSEKEGAEKDERVG